MNVGWYRKRPRPYSSAPPVSHHHTYANDWRYNSEAREHHATNPTAAGNPTLCIPSTLFTASLPHLINDDNIDYDYTPPTYDYGYGQGYPP